MLGGGCRVIGPEEGAVTRAGTRERRDTVGRAIDARDIAQAVSAFARGLSPGHVNPAGEEVHYVLGGSGTAYIDGYPYALEPGAAFYVPPGSEWCLENPGDLPVRLVSVSCPTLDRARHDLPPRTAPADATRPAPKRLVHERDRESIPTGIRTFKLLADKDVGCQRVTQFMGVIPPSEAPPHYHTYEEAIYIVEGRGVMWADGAEAPVEAGSCIYLPRGVRHSLKNDGDVPIRLLGVFHPAGSPAARYGEDEDDHH
jgi:mannose-6-phosphate isomerase-like protein (cupin superfamily)